jgi:hypothetical protein
VVKKDDFRLVLTGQVFDFFKFAGADKVTGIDMLQATANKGCRAGAG